MVDTILASGCIGVVSLLAPCVMAFARGEAVLFFRYRDVRARSQC